MGLKWDKVFADTDGDANLAEILTAAAGFVAVIGFTTPIVAFYWKGTPFDIQSFGTGIGVGIGAILAGLGGAQRLRGDVRKPNDQPANPGA
jgi:hypothetical protein